MARNKENLARRKIGYALTVYHENGPKRGTWERVGFVEPSKDVLKLVQAKQFAHFKTFKITGIRVNSTPLVDPARPSERNSRS